MTSRSIIFKCLPDRGFTNTQYWFLGEGFLKIHILWYWLVTFSCWSNPRRILRPVPHTSVAACNYPQMCNKSPLWIVEAMSAINLTCFSVYASQYQLYLINIDDIFIINVIINKYFLLSDSVKVNQLVWPEVLPGRSKKSGYWLDWSRWPSSRFVGWRQKVGAYVRISLRENAIFQDIFNDIDSFPEVASTIRCAVRRYSVMTPIRLTVR